MKRTSIFSRAARDSARSATRQLSSLQGDMRRLRDNMEGLDRAIKAAKIPTGPRYVKSSRTSLSGYETALMSVGGNYIANNLLEGAGLGGGASFDSSIGQLASSWLLLAAKGERIS